MDNIDLRLLKIFDELFKTGSVSQTADRLSLGQPAVSMSLRKLRDHFNDPLFIKTGSGMVPSSLAEQLIEHVRQAIGVLHTTLDYRASFDPAKSQRVFRLSMNDVAQIVILPSLLEVLKQHAPMACLELSGVADASPHLLAEGEIDILIGFIPRLEAGIYQQKLLDEKFVCVVDRHHPRIHDELSLEQFQSEPHLAVSTAGTGHGLIDQVLAARGIGRHVSVRIPNFSGIAAAIEGTEYLVVVPQRLGAFLEASGIARVYALPLEAPGYLVMQHWHERYHRDPGNQWLRSTIAHLFDK